MINPRIDRGATSSPSLYTSQLEKSTNLQIPPPLSFLCIFSIHIPGFSMATSGQLVADSAEEQSNILKHEDII